MVAQHFEDRPARRAGRLAVIGHAGLSTRQQCPAHMGGGWVLRAQVLEHRHGGLAVWHGRGQADKAALADLEVRVHGGGKRVGGQGGGNRPKPAG
ncbi:hypothetical protein D3C85_1495420 [compost metagenome]